MKIIDDIREEIESLISEGTDMLKLAAYEFASSEEISKLSVKDRQYVNEKRKERGFINQYNQWYTKSLKYVSLFIPSREKDFIELFCKKNAERRSSITVINYGIQDALLGIQNTYKVNRSFGYTLFDQQLSILKSVIGVYESSINALLFEIQEQILDDEIASARKLIKINLRASGALAGVILERHLKIVCNSHSLVISKKDPTINDYNDCLKANNVIQVDVFRHIQYLGDLRNLCDHSKSSDPTLDNVTTLIDGVEKLIKTLF